MEKLKMQTANGVQSNIERIAMLFPNCVTETVDANGAKKLTNFIKSYLMRLLKVVKNVISLFGLKKRNQFFWLIHR